MNLLELVDLNRYCSLLFFLIYRRINAQRAGVSRARRTKDAKQNITQLERSCVDDTIDYENAALFLKAFQVSSGQHRNMNNVICTE